MFVSKLSILSITVWNDWIRRVAWLLNRMLVSSSSPRCSTGKYRLVSGLSLNKFNNTLTPSSTTSVERAFHVLLTIRLSSFVSPSLLKPCTLLSFPNDALDIVTSEVVQPIIITIRFQVYSQKSTLGDIRNSMWFQCMWQNITYDCQRLQYT